MKKAIPSLLMAGALAVSAGVQAATVTDSFSLGPLTTDLTTATATGNLAQFDSSLGTLTSISLILSGDSTSTTSIDNNSAQSQRFAFDSTLDWEFEVLAGTGNFVTGFTTDLAHTGGRVSLASGATLDLGTTTDNGSITLTFSGPDLAQFIGTGNVGIGCNTFTGSAFNGGGGNLVANQVTSANCSGDITYNYDGTPPPVGQAPEPAAAWLIGAGLLGFVGFRARKSS